MTVAKLDGVVVKVDSIDGDVVCVSFVEKEETADDDKDADVDDVMVETDELVD